MEGAARTDREPAPRLEVGPSSEMEALLGPRVTTEREVALVAREEVGQVKPCSLAKQGATGS